MQVNSALNYDNNLYYYDYSCSNYYDNNLYYYDSLAPTTTTTTSTTTTTLAPTTTIQNLKTYKWRVTAYDVDGNLYQGATLYEIEGQPGKCEFIAKYPDSDKVYSLYFRQRMVYDANQNVLETITVEELGSIWPLLRRICRI